MHRTMMTVVLVALILVPGGAIAQDGGGNASPDAPKGIAYFERLIGTWDLTISNGETSYAGVWEFRYIMGGNAVYDESSATLPNGRVAYGANIRIYDPSTDTWKTKLIGTNDYRWREYYDSVADDDRIVDYLEMDSGQGDGTLHWRGTIHDITADRFEVTAKISNDGGATWSVSSTAVAKRRR